MRESWEIGENLERPRAWRLPMSAVKRHGPGWVAIGDAAGLVNPMNGEGIDYGLESGMLAADLFLDDPATAPAEYDRQIGQRFDDFLRTGRRFAFLIGHPWLMRQGLRFAVGTDAIAKITLQVMGNLVDADTPGASGRTMRVASTGAASGRPGTSSLPRHRLTPRDRAEAREPGRSSRAPSTPPTESVFTRRR